MASQLLLLLVCVAYASAMASQSQGTEKELLEHLFENYNPVARPHGTNGTTQCGFDFQITRLDYFNTKRQVLDLDAIAVFEWHDLDLVWEPSHYNDLHYINVPYSNVWTPDVILFDSAGNPDALTKGQFDVHIHYDGTVVYAPIVELHVYCHTPRHISHCVNISCTLEFASHYYADEELALHWLDEEYHPNLALYGESHFHPDFDHQYHIVGQDQGVIHSEAGDAKYTVLTHTSTLMPFEQTLQHD